MGEQGTKLSSGWARGMKIQAPAGLETRPTGSKVRAAVINMLQTRLEGARVLDLYAGSGAVAMEMLSRGAASATLVEKAKAPLACIKANAAELARRAAAQGLKKPEIQVIAASVLEVLESLARGAASAGFDIVWTDPPYKDVPGIIGRLHQLCEKILAPGGCLVIECAAEEGAKSKVESKIDLDQVSPGWESVKDRSYGVTRILVREYNPEVISK